MGARLRLKASTPLPSGADAGFTRIFAAMKKYGLIVADNGSDMYVSGTYDVNWNNDVLNPLFAALTASDFEVVKLGWKPSSAPAALSSVTVAPSTVTGGTSATGTVALTPAAPSGGAAVTLSTDNGAVSVPPSVTVGAGAASAAFNLSTSVVSSTIVVHVSASYGGVVKSTALMVTPPPAAALASLTLEPAAVSGGATSVGTVTLTAPAPSGGAAVSLTSGNPSAATVPPGVTVAAGKAAATFTVSTAKGTRNTSSVVSATYLGVTKSATLSIRKGKTTIAVVDPGPAVVEGRR